MNSIFFLGNSRLRPLEIAHPWSHQAEEYRVCYREIVASVDGLADALKD